MSKTRNFFSILTLLLLVAAGYFVMTNQQAIADHVAVFQYEATDEVASIAEVSSMSRDGRFYFYAGRPEVVGAELLNQHCQRREGSSPILGCFTNDRIYIFDVKDDELAGIKEVTAAHEMLHVVYSRMTRAETAKLEPQLEAAYQRLKTPELQKRMDIYQTTEPGQHYNELHSILGTEFKNLGPELNRYFDRFFANRDQLVAKHLNYSDKFLALQGEARVISERLQSERMAIDTLSSGYHGDLATLNADISQFNHAAGSGGFDSQASFARARSALASRTQAIEQRRLQLESRIVNYNSDVEKLNALGQKIDKLNSSIDSFEGIK